MATQLGQNTAAPVTRTPAEMAQAVMTHPLFDHSVLVRTNPSDELFRVIKQVVLLRDTGCVFTGESRAGKTDGLERVRAMLVSQFPRLCIYSHDAHNQQISSVRAFFKHFLATVGHREQKGETYDLRERLVRVLVDDARVSGINMVVMFIDEASAMQISDFLFLKDVYNDLTRAGVQLITIMMGQSPDMQHVIDDLIVRGRSDLVSRFATRVHKFRNFRDVADIQVIFEAIDTREYPRHSGISWPAFFLPHAWQSGFRLVGEAQRFFDAVVTSAHGTAQDPLRFPAGATFLAIRQFFLSATQFDKPNIKLPADIWKTATEDALMQEAITRMEPGRALGKQRMRK